jgi:integrase
VHSYQSNLRLHVVPCVGDVHLQALTALDLDRLYRQLLESGRQGGGKLSPRTVRYVHTILSAALKDAVNKGLLSRNPAVASSPPAAGATKAPEMAWWRPNQLKEFLAFVAADDIGTLIRVAAMTGMRRGEVVGLRWIDVDLPAGRLTVRRQLASVNYKVRWDRPKSEKGRRTIDLDDDTLSVLEQSWELVSSLPANNLGLVFPRSDGTPRHPEQVSSAFERLVTQSALPRIRMHDLRHTHAAHLIAAGVDPLTISRRLGHASVSFTLDRYGHLMAQAGANAAKAVSDLVDDPDDPDDEDVDPEIR